jgi:hypothetical protein
MRNSSFLDIYSAFAMRRARTPWASASRTRSVSSHPMHASVIETPRASGVPGKALAYGVSVTDPCLGWDDTEALLDVLADGVRKRRLSGDE